MTSSKDRSKVKGRVRDYRKRMREQGMHSDDDQAFIDAVSLDDE